MKLKATISIFTLAVAAALLLALPCTAQQKKETHGTVVVESADYSKHDAKNKVTTLKGNIFLKYIEDGREGEVQIRGQEATVDEKAKTATAKGGVTVVDGDVEISGETLFYRFEDRYFEMSDVSGATEAGEREDSRMYFRGQRALGTERKIKIFHATFSTCGPYCPSEYHMTASNISIFPDKKVIARKVGVYLRNTRVMYLPVYIASLKDDDNYRPEFGYNKTEGMYMKNRYPYIKESSPDSEARDSKAWLILNFMEKIGNEYGTENNYYSGRAGGKGFFLFTTNNQKNTGATNQSIQLTQDFSEWEKVKGGFKYNRTNRYNQNQIGSRTNTNRVDLNMNYTQSAGKTVATTYSLTANKGTSESETSTLNVTRKARIGKKLTLDYTFTKNQSQSGLNPKNEEGTFRSTTNYMGKGYRLSIVTFKNFDMDGDEYPNDNTVSVNSLKLPQITMTLDRKLWQKKLPMLTSFQLIHSRLRRGTRSDSEALRRSEAQAVAQKKYQYGKFSFTPKQTYIQRFYSTKDAMYEMDHTTQMIYDYNESTKLTANYRKMGNSGGAPYPGDTRNEQITLNGNLTINKKSTDPITRRQKLNTTYRMSTSYNYKTLKYSPLSISYVRNMSKNSTIQLTGARDLNNHRWGDATTKFDIRRKNTVMAFTPVWNTRDFDMKTMNFKTTHTRRNGWQIDIRGQYQKKNDLGLIREIVATKTRCCTEMEFYYSFEKDEFKFQYYILAFPSKKFGFTQGEQGFELDDSFTEFKSESTGDE